MMYCHELCYSTNHLAGLATYVFLETTDYYLHKGKCVDISSTRYIKNI